MTKKLEKQLEFESMNKVIKSDKKTGDFPKRGVYTKRIVMNCGYCDFANHRKVVAFEANGYVYRTRYTKNYNPGY